MEEEEVWQIQYFGVRPLAQVGALVALLLLKISQGVVDLLEVLAEGILVAVVLVEVGNLS
jgi:hypothetical protein